MAEVSDVRSIVYHWGVNENHNLVVWQNNGRVLFDYGSLTSSDHRYNNQIYFRQTELVSRRHIGWADLPSHTSLLLMNDQPILWQHDGKHIKHCDLTMENYSLLNH